ncbi:hypothetical protein BZA05DRAFT_443436 [Tricharina praecox]|uniref:uncharacterized protein n=1 Tax=Tricharina praecox TaxID=43433 RepID=UPI00221F443C|nr:uncharacterized protein BZA05DRAFT_443436 [Tricharina praecox]KAI5854795.1 hypothetical protein BZA05DRAFT_443436 [Tricharina praecox]
MRRSASILLPLFLTLSRLADARFGSDKILISSVKSLTLRNDQVTTGRRLDPIPQLKCVGGDAKGLYEIDVMRCKNMGSDYGDEDISWSCTADVPKYFKLGSTDVLCEGYANADDRHILKGSCGAEYRLILTDEGLEKYGGAFLSFSNTNRKPTGGDIWSFIFMLIFLGMLGTIFYSAWTAANAPAGARRPAQRFDNGGSPWFGGGGGGDDPPPPYDPRPPGFKSTSASNTPGWRPGFWSGMAAGAAGTYIAGRGGRGEREREPAYGGYRANRPVFGGSGGESSSAGAVRHETTGFGQTRRR